MRQNIVIPFYRGGDKKKLEAILNCYIRSLSAIHFKHKLKYLRCLIRHYANAITDLLSKEARENPNNKTKPLRKPLEWEPRVQGSIIVLTAHLLCDLEQVYRHSVFCCFFPLYQ